VGLEQSVVYLSERASVLSCENNINCLAYAKFNVAIALLKKSHALRAFWYDIGLGG
jgi:hypothetical protein